MASPSPSDADPQLRNAVGFLSHPKVKPSATADKVAFLKKKGLTNDQIARAFQSIDPQSQEAKDVLAGKYESTAAASGAVTTQTPASAVMPQYIPPPPPPASSGASSHRWITYTLGGLALLALGGAAGYAVQSYINPVSRKKKQSGDLSDISDLNRSTDYLIPLKPANEDVNEEFRKGNVWLHFLRFSFDLTD